MKLIDIFLSLIVVVGIILVTYTYLNASPPSFVLSKEYGEVEIVGVSGDKCTIEIAGEIKNEGDFT